MTYRNSEKKRITALRDLVFNDPGNGEFAGKGREFVLNDPSLNLWEGIRKDALHYFTRHGIQWWKGDEAGPNGHLLSSQIACINHLYPIRQRQDLATLLLQELEPSVCSAVIVDDGYVEFEFIGKRQLLKERGFTRGANCTSVDAVMIGELRDGERCVFLIEWKYTEFYAGKNMYIPERAKVYDHLIAQDDSPFSLKTPEPYYFEPFYQLMRQTLLGWQLAQHKDHGCSQYRHIHVVPDENKDLTEHITSPDLRQYGSTISSVWRSTLVAPERFISISPEKLMSPLSRGSDSQATLAYLRKRYWSPRQNRVTPFGEFIATSTRGSFMGNRGILHDENGGPTNRRWAHKTWVTCALSFKGRRSPINAPGSYTQLFFLDEATALAAGHRPCGECRREDFNRFKEAWLRGNTNGADFVSAASIDAAIHAERITGKSVKPEVGLGTLPDGVMVSLAGAPDQSWLLWERNLHRWTPQGYGDKIPAQKDLVVTVLTPASVVRTILAGYVPSTSLKENERASIE